MLRRARCVARASAIRAATTADASGSMLDTIARPWTRDSVTQLSIRSRSGPEIRSTYRSGTPLAAGTPRLVTVVATRTWIRRGD